MKNIKSYIFGLLAAALVAPGFTSCQDDVDAPKPVEPVASLKSNISILDLKKKFWGTEANYIDTIGLVYDENNQPVYNADGSRKIDENDYIIHGYVTTSDEAGNVFKSLVIQDETASLAISINSYNLYLKYRRGQEVIINLKGMYIGKYNGLLQLGYPQWYENGKVWETSFMAPEFFAPHAELNGWPDIAKIDTIQVNNFSEIGSNPEEFCRWQSQLVRFNNVHFEGGGELPFSEYQSSGVNRTLLDVNETPITVRTSGYANFWNMILPKGSGDVVGICSYFNNAWQVTLIDYEGCMNFGNPTVPPGSENNPFTVEQVIANESASINSSGWVTGYIVGAVAADVETEIKSNDDIEWTAPTVLANTLVIGATPDTKDISQCLVMALPSGSALRNLGNLRENPDNLGKQIWVKGTFGKYMETYGITDCRGTVAEFKIEGVETETPVEEGDGSEASPYNCAQIMAMGPQSTTEAVQTGVWAEGYIVGYYANYAANFSTSGAVATNILISDDPAASTAAQCICIQLVAQTDARAKLNLLDNPGNLGKKVAVYGDVMKYNTLPGIKNTSNYTIDGASSDDPTPPAGNGSYGYTTTVAGGNTYAFVADGKAAKNLDATYNYGYFKTADVTVADNKFSTSEPVDFTLETVSGGYYLKDSYGRYVYMSGAYNTFNVSATVPESGAVWTVTVNADGRALVTNVEMGKTLQYDPQFGSYGAYSDVRGTYPMLFLKGASGEVVPDNPNPDPNPSGDGDGSEANPFTCAQVISLNPQSTTEAVKSGVWAEGYIVGFYANYAANFSTSGAVATNILLSDSPLASDVKQCICIQLVAQTDARAKLNLLDNPGNLGKKAAVYGDVMKYNSMAGIKNTSNYVIDGASGPDDPTPPAGTASFGYTTTLSAGNIYALYADGKVATNLNASYTYGYLKTVDATVADNKINVAETCGFTLESTTGGYYLKDSYGRYLYMTGTYNSFNVSASLPESGAVWTATVNADGRVVITNVAMGKSIQYDPQYGSYGAYSDVRGTYPMLFLKGAAGENVPNVNPNPNPNPDPDPEPAGDYKGDFNSFNNGTPKSSPYAVYTNATGWSAANSIVLSGSSNASASNPYFNFIGGDGVLAVCLNGKTSAPGVLTSPTLAGGISTLTFKYGFPFNESKCEFTVEILQGGQVVKSDTVTLETLETKKAYEYTLSGINVTGDFQIVIRNNSLSGQDKNCDRVAIWNLTWE